MSTLNRDLVMQHAPLQGRNRQTFIAMYTSGQVAADFAEQTLTIQGAVAKSATTITLAVALTAKINPGQYLVFVDANDVERLVRVSAESTGTTLNIDPADEAIADASTSQYPPYLTDRTDTQIADSTDVTAVATYNTGSNVDGTPGDSTQTVTLPGLLYHYNAALKTAREAKNTGSFVWAQIREPAPNPNFLAGELQQGRAIVTTRNSNAPTSTQITDDLTLQFAGEIQRTNATPVP